MWCYKRLCLILAHNSASQTRCFWWERNWWVIRGLDPGPLANFQMALPAELKNWWGPSRSPLVNFFSWKNIVFLIFSTVPSSQHLKRVFRITSWKMLKVQALIFYLKKHRAFHSNEKDHFNVNPTPFPLEQPYNIFYHYFHTVTTHWRKLLGIILRNT